MVLLGYGSGNNKETGRPYWCFDTLVDNGVTKTYEGFGERGTRIFVDQPVFNTLKPALIGCEFTPQYTLNAFGKPVVSVLEFD